ncbi:hypothetical protein BHE74_00044812 [Ensete ventricosum]|nr:hypothetical protein GW17_00004210 [Ensete ventricosum]RWW49065.1 hypothetical protein BHE74_00044812 [Ensete ventricosum]
METPLVHVTRIVRKGWYSYQTTPKSGLYICAVRQPPPSFFLGSLGSLAERRGRRREQSMAPDRRIGVAMDFSPCCKAALRWAAENVVRDGDHVIVVNVQKEGCYEEGEMQLWETTGSRMDRLLPRSLSSDPLRYVPLSV